MISTRRFAAASFAFFFSFLTLIAPAFAAGANQGSSDDVDVVLTEHEKQIIREAAPSAFPGQPLPQVGALDSTNYSSGLSLYVRNSQNVYASSDANHIVCAFKTGSYLYYCCLESGATAYYYQLSNSTGYNAQLISYDDAGVYHSSGVNIGSNSTTTAPIYSSASEGYVAAKAFLESVSDPAATLVSNGNSFSFNSDYSVNNTTGVDIAVASYNLGGNDIIVIGCYETVVVPGTIGGLSANYNVNQTLPREQHIPIRYCSLISDTTFSSLIPFDSLDAAVAACYGVLQNSPNHGGGYTPSDVQFTLQPGNVAYIQMADLSEKVILSSAKSSYSALFQTAGSYWPGNQLYKSGMDYPTAGTVLPGATPNQIPWQKNEWGKENLLGQTKQAYAEITASSNLLMIYNPYYQGDDSSTLTNSNLINSAIVISSKGIARNGIRVYNLQDSFSTVDGNYYYGIGSTNPNGYGDYFQSENDPNATNPDVTGWTDENGDPTTAPGVTPYNDPPDNDSLADVITGFLSNIGSLFTQGHDAIKNLVESSSEFTSRLSSLFAWLPPPVYSVLISAIILAIIVGVLKVFL